MKKIKKIGGLALLFFITFYTSCFADVVMPGQSGHPAPLTRNNNVEKMNYVPLIIFVSLLVLSILVCSILTLKLIFKKKEQNQDKDNSNN